MPTIDGSPAYFEVCDLAADDRFNTLPFVAGPPFFKYYCGVPLRSNNINIGSIFVLDDIAREPIGLQDSMMLGRMGDLVIAHLQTMKEKQDLKRTTNMNMALAAFVDPENRKRRRRSLPHSDAGSQTKTVGLMKTSWQRKLYAAKAKLNGQPMGNTRYQIRQMSLQKLTPTII
jgi:GAF domain-containing protein